MGYRGQEGTLYGVSFVKGINANKIFNEIKSLSDLVKSISSKK
jgi:hypothetical protein